MGLLAATHKYGILIEFDTKKAGAKLQPCFEPTKVWTTVCGFGDKTDITFHLPLRQAAVAFVVNLNHKG